MTVCVRRKAAASFLAGLSLLALWPLGGCAGFHPRNENTLNACRDENTRLRLELNLKNDRLDKFHQLNKDGSLKGQQ